MPADYNGYWKMIFNENFEEYLKALGKFYIDNLAVIDMKC